MHSKDTSTLPFFRRPAVNNGLFTVLSLFGAALSYLLYPIIAKVISPTEFGDVSVVIAIAGQIGGILLAFNVISIYIVNTHSKEDAIRISEIIQKLLIQVLFGATLVVLLFSPMLLSVLKIGSVWTILGLGAIILLSVPAVLWTGFLQGHNELARIGAYNTIAAGSKLLFAGTLCVMGFGATGAIIGIIIGQVIALWSLRFIPGTELPAAHGVVSSIKAPEWVVIKSLAGYIAESLVVVICFSALFAIDIILAKAFFPPYEAGIYSGIASLGRIIFFGVSILTWIMLANTSSADPEKSLKALKKFLLMAIAGGGVVTAGFWLAASPVISLSLGSAYLVVREQLWLVGVSQLLTSVLYGYTLYLLVLRRTKPAVLAILIAVCAIGLGATNPHDPRGLLIRLIIGQIAGYLLYLVLVSVRNITKRATSNV